MPFKKINNEKKTCLKQNKVIKKRLMQISIYVDNYIYKHKQITIDEATMYGQEISLYKTQCNGDIHILQVIDKLTRCLKSIVEETTENLTLNRNAATSEKVESINMSLESTVNINLENIIMAKTEKNHREILASKNILPTIAVTIDCKNGHKTNDVIVNNENLNKFISKDPVDDGELETINKTIDCNYNSIDGKGKLLITTDNILDIDHFKITSTENNPLQVGQTPMQLLNKDHLRPGFKNYLDTQQLKVNQAKTNIRVNTQSLNDNHNITQKHSQTTKNDLKSTVTLEKNQQLCTASLSHINTKNYNIEITQRANNSINKAITETNISAQVKSASEKKKKNATKKGANKENISNTAQRRKKSKINPRNNTINSKTPSKFKHTNVNSKNNEISIAAWDKNKPGKIISQVHNKCIGNNLMWIESIRYVREVNANEFVPKLSGLEDNFWDNFSLPEGWSDVEFLY